MTYGHIKTWLDDIDQRRQRAEPPKRRCPACGEYHDDDEFDDAGADFQADHMADLRAHFGGLVCNACADSHAVCHGCNTVSGDARVKFGACCDECKAKGYL